MQVNSPFRIELIFKDTIRTQTIRSFNPYSTMFLQGQILEALIEEFGKPIGFRLIQLNLLINSPKLIYWLQTEFKNLFDPNPILWFASVGTMPIELHQYLIPFYAE